MRVLLLSAAPLAALLLAGCHENFSYEYTEDPGKTPKLVILPTTGLDVTFSEPNSPMLSKWSNGKLVVSCPTGYHFSDPINAAPSTNRTCEPNDLPPSKS